MLNFKSGCSGRVIIGGVNLACTRWSITERVEEIDVTSAEEVVKDNVKFNNPLNLTLFRSWLTGIREADISLDAIWDLDNNIVGEPPYITPGTRLANIKLVVSADPFHFTQWEFPFAYVMSAVTDAEVRGLITYKLTLKSDGPYYPPGLKPDE